MKRYALSGTRQELLAAAKLLDAAPDPQTIELLLKGFEEAYQGRSLAGIPTELVAAISRSGGGSTPLKLRQGDPLAIQEAVNTIKDKSAKSNDRVQYLQILGELRRPEFVPILLDAVRGEHDETLASAALTALQAFDDQRVGQVVIQRLPHLPGDARLVAETLLASRSSWAMELLSTVDSGTLQPADVSETALRKMLLHDNERVQQLIAKHWGTVAGATTERMRQDIERLAQIVHAGAGNPKRGKPVFMQHCGKCHRLFDEGGDIGPDLTAFQRDDLPRMLVNVVNPSAEIREGFENYLLLTTDGRVVNGFLADQDSQVVVLRGVDGQNLIFRRDEIEELRAIPRSVMPEGTWQDLSEQQFRDLVAYFRSSQPVNY
jgi:putative heme-binding domain-containing protein